MKNRVYTLGLVVLTGLLLHPGEEHETSQQTGLLGSELFLITVAVVFLAVVIAGAWYLSDRVVGI